MEIVNVFSSRGFPVKRQGKTWGSPVCPSCGPGDRHSNKLCLFVGGDGRERWYCHACGSRGDTADLIALVEGIPLKEALRKNKQREAATTITKTPSIDTVRAVHKSLLDSLPKWQERAAQYLIQRGIGRQTIKEASERGLLRMLPSDPAAARDVLLRAAGGAERLVEAGLWAGRSSSWPAQAFRPLVFFVGETSSEWRLIDHQGTQYPKSIRLGVLTKPMVWRADPAEVVVVEGAIDLLSLVEMGEKRTIMALPGVNAWRIEWFAAAHKAYGSRFVIALDNDEAGNRMATSMMAALQTRGIDCKRIVPVHGKDWNEMLVAAA